MLLNESGMENHPLTPMKDANLVRVLQRQTKSPVGLIRYDTIALGAAAVRTRIEQLRAEGVRFAIADALSDRDLYVLGEACAGLPLVTGGSGIALGLPANFRRAEQLPERDNAASLPRIEGLSTVLAGSASKALRRSPHGAPRGRASASIRSRPRAANPSSSRHSPLRARTCRSPC